jgi:GDSL-like Lipase/Acylhydrolase family
MSRWIVVGLLGPIAGVTASVGAPAGRADARPLSIDITAAGPLGAVSVIGDSVLLGSALWGPTLPDRLAERGWGPIKFRAGEGYRTHGTGEPASTYWIRLWRSQGWDAPNVIVNIGANDSGICNESRSCALGRIQELVDEIGPGHTIWWPKISLHSSNFAKQEIWNQALQQVADTRDDFHTWDWPSDLVPFVLADGTHMSPDGYRTRSIRMAEVFTHDVARSRRVGGSATLPTPEAPPSTFVAVPAKRLVDSRIDGSGRRRDGSTLRVDLGDSVPPDAAAVAVYIGAADPSESGYFAAGPCGAPIDGSTVNFSPGSAVGAPTIVPVGDDGSICVFTRGDADIVIDVQGAFVARDDGLRFDPVEVPKRLVDTRTTPPRGNDRTAEVSVAVPPGAESVAVNLTAVAPAASGFLSAYPCGSRGGVANVNYRTGVTTAAFAIVNVSEDDTICITTSAATDILVDITGVFIRGPGLRFVAVTPTRTLDTRQGIGGWDLIHGADQSLSVRVAPSSARAVTGTLTIVRPLDHSFVTTDACTGASSTSPTSSANADDDTVVANSLTTAVTTAGELCFTASAPGQTVFDTTGWWVAT